MHARLRRRGEEPGDLGLGGTGFPGGDIHVGPDLLRIAFTSDDVVFLEVIGRAFAGWFYSQTSMRFQKTRNKPLRLSPHLPHARSVRQTYSFPPGKIPTRMNDSSSDPTANDPPRAAALQAAGQWIARGQALEAQEKPAALAEAVRSYDAAIALVRALPGDRREPTGFHLGVAWMNRGNALQKQATPESLAESLRSYDAAIAAFRTLPPALPPPARNALGAAWLNRGVSLHRLPSHDRLDEAVQSFREALAVLDAPPADDSPWHRRNLAGVRLNLANALLDRAPPATEEASVLAREAVEHVRP